MYELLEKYQDNEEAQNAIRLIFNTNDTVFLTGRAGSGKSTLLAGIVDAINKKCVILAPTGVAALNVGGQTIHSFFRLSQKPYAPQDDDIEIDMPNKVSLKKIVNAIDLIIIDEVSMVRADIMCAIDYSLRLMTGCSEPFGGKQLLLIGDLYQLPPVVQSKDEEEKEILSGFYKTPYFFSATPFESKLFNFHFIELQKVYRQADPQFIDLLNAVRDNNCSDNQLAELNKLVGVQKGNATDKSAIITLATTNSIADNLNASRLKAIESKLFAFKAEIEGDFLRKASLPTNPKLELKAGAQIMFIKNDGEKKRWVNGDLGKILSITKLISGWNIEIQLDRNKATHYVNRETWENYKYKWDADERKITKDVTGSFVQFPIKLAWAVTIHKSQGQTFDDVIIDLGYGAFAAGQLYVALSRCRTMQGIRLTKKIQRKDIIVNEDIKAFLGRALNMKPKEHQEMNQVTLFS